MSRPTRSKLSPWIERLILNYGNQDGGSSSSRLKAQVIGVGQMSQSQAQGSEGPTGLLFLSDGVLQIPAILTASAWDHLQDQEERECFTSLLNHTVFIQNHTLQFHMAPEQTKCRFFLSVGELATTAVGPVRDSTPCCTTLPSVRQKICETWKALLSQEGQGSQSQCGFDLTELLGEWQHDCLQSVLEDIKERLIKESHAVEPQPSTSTFTPSLTYPDTFAATSWDIERVRYKREKCFTVPMNYLLIPEKDAQHLQEHLDAASSTSIEVSAGFEERSGDLPQVLGTANPSVDDVDWQIVGPALTQVDCVTNKSPQFDEEDDVLDEAIIRKLKENKIRLLSNPWDMFPPPDETSSEDISPCATQDHPPVGILTSTQLPAHSSAATPLTSELNSKGDQSELVPYQKPPSSTCVPITVSTSASATVTPPEPFTRPDEACAEPEKTNLLASEQESQIFEEVMVEGGERKFRKAKRKRSEPSAEAQNLLAEEEAQVSGSPPSWLFESKSSSGLEEGSSYQPDNTIEPLCRKIPTVHSDGKKFSYSYQVSGRNLQDFSKFKFSGSLLNWAVKYLVTPRQLDNQHNTSATSNKTPSDRTEITPLHGQSV